jgi:hypothetical protein
MKEIGPTMDYKGVPWAYSALKAKFWKFDARILIPIGLFFLHWSSYTLALALCSIMFFYILDYFGLSLETFFYRFRAILVGPIRASEEIERLRRRAGI